MFSQQIENYRIAKGPPKNSSIAALLANAVYRKNIDAALLIIESVFADDNCVFEHPGKPGISTKPKGQITLGMWNAIVFSDISNNHPWVLVQSTSFVDLLITDDEVYYIGKNPSPYVQKQVVRIIEHINDQLLWKGEGKKIAFCIGQTTPFHFFYDQFKYLPFVCSSKKVYRNKHPVFYDPSIYGIELIDKPEPGYVYFYPAAVTQNSCNALGFGGCDRQQKIRNTDKFSNSEVAGARVRHCMEFMEQKIQQDGYSLKTVTTQKAASTVLWIGITSSKRAWVEQVQGYIDIIHHVAQECSELTVLVDGMTSSIDQEKVPAGDTLVFNEINKQLSQLFNVTLKSLIGMDYKTKVAYCKTIDAFICNGGTGSFVPMRVCNKPGVIHTNTRLLTFPDQYRSVEVITGEDTGEQNELDAAGTTSYSLSWRAILGPLMNILKK